jgi:hypothetical protein
MKNLKVTISLDMEIPEDWEIVQHPDGVPALSVGGGMYMYMSFLPMFTEQLEPESNWTSECSEDFSDEVLEMVQGEEVEMKLEVH